MHDELALTLAGEALVLYAERALYWPREHSLILADLHLGKTDHFRRAGIALPRGGTGHDLDRLDELLQRSGARRLLVLGDFLHGQVGDAPWRARLETWRQTHATLAIDVVAGNHDRVLRQSSGLAQALDLQVHHTPLHMPPFVFVHQREEAAPDSGDYVLAGHVHPVVRLPGLPRLPAFALSAASGLLPAFSSFTGGQAVKLGEFTRIFACGPGAIVGIGSA